MVGSNIATDYPVFDNLEDHKIEKVSSYVKLYRSVNKITGLGLSFDESRLSALEVNALWVLNSTISEVMKRRKRKR